MGVGFIQLITNGEDNIFTNKPQITYFKIYYRRYSNFFINNYEIPGNNVKNANNMVNFIIPKSGDFLSKSYVNININENYTELFNEYTCLNTTLIDNTLNFYDSYSTRVETFNINMINTIDIGKFNFIHNNKIYFILMSTNIINSDKLLSLIKFTNNITLETDIQKLFYNCNQIYNFYSFNVYNTNTNTNNTDINSILSLLLNTQNNLFDTIKIDIINYNLSFNIKFNNNDLLNNLIMLILNDISYENVISLKINKYDIYFKLDYNNLIQLNILYNKIINIILANIIVLDLEVIDNKIKSTFVKITDNIVSKLTNLFNNINSNYYIYYNIIYNFNSTNVQLYLLKDTPFFGNFSNNDFNESLIANETQLITVSNLCSYQLPINLYIRLIISLICNNVISIQEYLKIINNPSFNVITTLSTYFRNTSNFDNKILDILVNPLVIIFSKDSFRKLLYDYSIKENYGVNNLITPFTNKKVSDYNSIINYKYLYSNLLLYSNNKYNQSYNNFDIFISLLINLNIIYSSNIQNSSKQIFENNLYNYNVNNNLFDKVEIFSINNNLITTNTTNTINNNIYDLLCYNYVLNYITESITSINNIFFKISDSIYDLNGLNTNLINSNFISNSIFPLSSSITVNTRLISQASNTYNGNYMINSIVLFNTTVDNYFVNLVNLINKSINIDFNSYNINFNNTSNTISTNEILSNTFLSKFVIAIKNYYTEWTTNQNLFNLNKIQNYMFFIKNGNFEDIYEYPNSINDFVLKNLFIYTSTNLYSNSFLNFNYSVPNGTSTGTTTTNLIDEQIYLSFIFIVNSPIYRIYFMFTYLARLSLDLYYSNYLTNDLINLRDFTLYFILQYILYFNNTSLSDFNYSFNNYDISMLKNRKYDLINNFLCYDNINIFDNTYFQYLLYQDNINLSTPFLYLYNSSYFIKNITSTNFLDTYKYNYDDIIIILYLNTLQQNSSFFNNFSSIYSFVNIFFNKVYFNFDALIVETINILSYKSDVEISSNNLRTDGFYYRCYYTTNSVGCMFDNNNKVLVNSTNNIYNITLSYNNYDELFKNFYFIKTFDIKQYENYLNITNLTDGFKYINTFFNNLFYINNNSSYRYYDQLLNSIYFYISSNYEYLNKYIISEYIFNNAIDIILKYLTIFNVKNNSTISLNISKDSTYPFSYGKFTKFNYIIIYYLYYSFIKNCCIVDVNSFNSDNQVVYNNLNKYIISLYSINIYIECLNDLINLFSQEDLKIYLDYSTIFILNSPLNKSNELEYILDYLAYMEIVFDTNVDYSEITNRVLFNLLNINSFITPLNINNSIYVINYEVNFYKDFNDQLNNFINQFNKVLYIVLYTNNLNKTNINLQTINYTLQNDYINKINILYENSLYILKNNIYNNLYDSYISINFNDGFNDKICNIIINTIKNYYNSNNNYFSSIFYKKCLNFSNNILGSIDKIGLFLDSYINTNINSSIVYEKEFNRILYYLCTNYAITLSIDKINATLISKNNSLYKFVKLYKIDINNNKKYLLDTSLYENQDIFELFNYNNWTNLNSFTQNYWFNYIISNIDYSTINSQNSYYYYFNNFNSFCVENYSEILNFKLSDGTSVINYFTENINNINELHNYIFEFSTLSDLFSPLNIYNSIINFKQSNSVSAFLTIDTDNIKKKIIIYLFMMYIVFINIPTLLKNNFASYNNNLFLEYNFVSEIVTFNLLDITTNIDTIALLNYYIEYIFLFDNKILNKPYNSVDLEYIIEKTKLECNFKDNYILLIQKYISTYNLIIGTENIVYDNAIPPNPTFTFSNLINRINSVFYNDTIIQNPNSYFLTINTINLLNINPINLTYDLNDIFYNKFLFESTIFINYFNNFRKSDVSNINFTLNLLCSLLKFYNITYSSLNNDISSIIENLRFASTYLNENLEIFKGVSTQFNISTDYVNYDSSNISFYDYSNSNTITSKSSNIKTLSVLTYDLKKLSLITPNDYDFTVNNLNYSNIYTGIYTKYYNYDYNYNNLKKNYIVIYSHLLSYYNNILKDNNAIANIKKYDIRIYTIIFIDIIKTIFANYYYNSDSTGNYIQDNIYYLPVINQVINLYLNYNFTFRINLNIKDSENLLIQKYYNKTVDFTSYSEAFNYLVSLYYYELLSDNITSSTATSSTNDIISFFNDLNVYQNYNFEYIFNLINFFFRFKLSIILFINLVSYNTNTYLTFNYSILSSIINDYLNLVVNPININKFLSIQSVDNNYTKDIYNKITNIIEYSDFLNKLTNSLSELLYYENNFSYQTVIYNVWVKYFKDYKFDYYYYSYNNYQIDSYILTFNNFKLIAYDFINYFVDNDYSINNNNVMNDLTEFIINVFNPISTNQEYIINLINSFLFNYNTTDNFNNNYINIKNSVDYFNNVKIIINTIKNTLKEIYWGNIYYVSTYNSKVNYNLKLQLFLFNFYYVYLNQEIIDISTYNTDFIVNYIKNYYKLYIIYNIIINVITLDYISNDIYNNIFYLSLINCNTYISYGEKILTLNLLNNIVVKLDYINKNIIPSNIINNYYKNVQDDTISLILKYNVNSFINTIYNNDNLLASIFDIITNQFYYKTETQIGSIFYNNLIICLINNYNSTVDITEVGIPGETIYINNLYKYLLVNINNNLDVYKKILGGYSSDINNINLTTQNLIQIYNTTVYEIDSKPITIFTLLYNQFNDLINNDMVIILYYYTVFITWLSINGNNYNNIEKYIYEFANLINVNITKYVSITNDIASNKNLTLTQITELKYLEEFFDGLNLILFNVYNNTEFSNLCSNFFNTYISNNYQYTNTNDAVNFNMISYSGNTSNLNIKILEKEYYNKQIYNSFIKNNKINTWKLMQGVIVDYNLSNVTKALKSILEINNIINVFDDYLKYISSLNSGIINKFGVIKIIDSIKLLFDDELIDDYKNAMYKIFINLFVNLNKYGLIYQMLGLNIDNNNEDYVLTGLKPFILNIKNKNYMVPLNFFFKDYNNIIPLIACMYTQIQININFNSNNLIKNSYTISQLTPSKMDTSLNMDLIFVERDERMKICSNLIDNLIERHGSYSNSVTITQDMLNNNTIFVKFDFHIAYMVKEIFWTLDFYINNYSLYNKTNYSSTAENIYDFILNTRFFVDGAKRDGVDILGKENYNYITTILNPYKYNTRAYSNANCFYNVYSFALEPENFQPTGAINLSKFNVFTVELEIDKNKLYNYINNFSNLYNLNKIIMTMNLNTLEYNLVRYQSGLSGLLFV